MEQGNEKFVRFDIWCDTCIHKTDDEFDGETTGGCYDCLAEPTNIDSTKPVNYKEAE